MCLLCCLLTFWYGAVVMLLLLLLFCAVLLMLWCSGAIVVVVVVFPCSVANNILGLLIVYINVFLSINLLLFFHDGMCRAVGGFRILYTVCTCHVISCCCCCCCFCFVYACVYKFCNNLHHDNIVWYHTTSSNQLLQPNNDEHYHGWSGCKCASCKVCDSF